MAERRVPRPGQVSLERALSKLGHATRTEARKLILEGRVKINGRELRDPLHPVVPEKIQVVIDEERRELPERQVILFHKPKGVITTRSDERGRETIFDRIEGLDPKLGLMPIGRLDLATSGLLLLTNDTRFSSWLLDPVNRVPRVYLVRVRGQVTPETVQRLEQGVESDGELLRADEVEIRKDSARETHLIVRLMEGKNREIRRMFLSQGHEVERLKRVSFGGIELGELPSGTWRRVTIDELERAFPGAPIRI